MKDHPHIMTVESRFVMQVAKQIRSQDLPVETAQFVTSNPHLWPFFLYPGMGQDFVAPSGKVDSPVAVARVYRGAWISNCPFCTSAQHVSHEDPWFFCADCKNSPVENSSVPVTWPSNRQEIETILMRRPWRDNQNWAHGETVKHLLDENNKITGHN